MGRIHGNSRQNFYSLKVKRLRDAVLLREPKVDRSRPPVREVWHVNGIHSRVLGANKYLYLNVDTYADNFNTAQLTVLKLF